MSKTNYWNYKTSIGRRYSFIAHYIEVKRLPCIVASALNPPVTISESITSWWVQNVNIAPPEKIPGGAGAPTRFTPTWCSVVTYCYEHCRRRKMKRVRCHSYAGENIHCRSLVAAKGLKKTDYYFHSILPHGKRIVPTLDPRCFSVYSTKGYTNAGMREYWRH